MGNAPSVEGPRKGTRTTQKLSKPRTGNPASAGLLTSSGGSDVAHRPSLSALGRRLSLPYSSVPSPSTRNLTVDSSTLEGLFAGDDESTPGDRSSRSLFRSSSSQQQRSQSVGVVPAQHRGRRITRTNSIHADSDDGQPPLSSSLSRNVSRTSVNYDLSSYEAKRLLNLVHEASLEDISVASESQFQVSVSRRQSFTRSQQPPSGTATPLARTNSDVFLYTPTRRRSLMTPGLATRPTPADAPPTVKAKPIHSLPATPVRKNSLEKMTIGMPPVPSHPFDPSSIPRVITPCEGEYRQTGAFKLGTLRITNGSPVKTPARETTEESMRGKIESGIAQASSEYFAMSVKREEEQRENKVANSDLLHPVSTTVTSGVTVNKSFGVVINQATVSAVSLVKSTPDGVERRSPELQTTSKHTAMEDELFDDVATDYSAEVLDIRMDPNAKFLSSRPGSAIEGPNPGELNRSDSGIVATPTSDTPHKALAKADSGYSSNVSLRSFSSKRNKSGLDPSQATENESRRARTFRLGELPPRKRGSRSSSSSRPELTVQVSSPGDPPLPVPKNSSYTRSRGVTTHKPNLDLTTNVRVDPNEPGLISGRAKPDTNNIVESSQPSPLSPSSVSTVPSPLSISNAARKQGRLQRLLSSARAPLTVHVTHALDAEVDVPPVPEAVQEKLRRHTATLPDSPLNREIGPKPIPSAPTQAKASIPQINVSASLKAAPKLHDRKSNHKLQAISSSISRTASSILSKKPIRNPLQSKSSFSPQEKTSNASAHASILSRGTSEFAVLREDVEINIRSTTFTTSVSSGRGRTGSDFVPSNELLDTSSVGDRERYCNGSLENAASSRGLLRKPSANLFSLSKTPPPPVSMRTRTVGPYRVPPPLRARSTPPVLSQKSSREAIQSYPPTSDGLSRRTSQESLHTYTPAQIRGLLNGIGPTPATKTGSSVSLESSAKEYRVPDWSTQPDSGSWQRPSFDKSRRNSLSSQKSGRSVSNHRQPELPTHRALKHCSSYDEYSSLRRDNGPYPSLHSDTAANNSWKTQHAAVQHAQQTPHYVPRISRTHLRHRSLDRQGPAAPYRILHSYNSPAYRHVPIWS
ncbi:hypothetical protein F5Y18DRAFT_118261 [Xylariaceae sp. FL1019]|nr:hypothetical protein F5Y18DRAFT_118261 [Xylariaceae sp. FL1019]